MESHAPLTFDEIARYLRVRTVGVREVLKSDPRFVAVRLPGRTRLAVGWMLRPVSREEWDEQGRVVTAGPLSERERAVPSTPGASQPRGRGLTDSDWPQRASITADPPRSESEPLEESEGAATGEKTGAVLVGEAGVSTQPSDSSSGPAALGFPSFPESGDSRMPESRTSGDVAGSVTPAGPGAVPLDPHSKRVA